MPFRNVLETIGNTPMIEATGSIAVRAACS
jgi:hypothetical protein